MLLQIIYCAMGKLDWLSSNYWVMKETVSSGKVNSLDREKFSPAMLDFIDKCLQKDPADRMTALQCLEHEWLQDTPERVSLGSADLFGHPTTPAFP